MDQKCTLKTKTHRGITLQKVALSKSPWWKSPNKARHTELGRTALATQLTRYFASNRPKCSSRTNIHCMLALPKVALFECPWWKSPNKARDTYVRDYADSLFIIYL